MLQPKFHDRGGDGGDVRFRLGHAELLTPHYVSKPWGRRPLSDDPSGGQLIGEIVYRVPDVGLTIKWLQTSKPLSVQVHPQGAGRKDEWWYVVEAQAEAYIDLGLKEPLARTKIAEAARNGSLPSLLNRITPVVGCSYFIRAGTIHALGPGLTVLEIQEMSDVTYRLFDYGRDRALHLAEALFEARMETGSVEVMPDDLASFAITRFDVEVDRPVTVASDRSCLAILSGEGIMDNQAFAANQCWFAHGSVSLHARKQTRIILVEPRNASKTRLNLAGASKLPRPSRFA